MWGIIPAAGTGSRIQPLAFSKELLPVGSRRDGDIERPRAVSEYIVERMITGGTDKICFVISPGKADILEYYSDSVGSTHICYVVQPRPTGLCDSIFRALPLVHPDEEVVVGLPDTIWFPRNALRFLGGPDLSFLLFPVTRPELFDAVITDNNSRVLKIEVKRQRANSNWIWGAFRTTGAILKELCALWHGRDCRDMYLGDLVNAYLAGGATALGIRAGKAYVDVGTLHGYREAMKLLNAEPETGE